MKHTISQLLAVRTSFAFIRIRIKDKDLFIGLEEFVMGYSKAPEQPQSSARPICHSHAMTRTGREPATIRIAAQELAALRTAPREGVAQWTQWK